ncbi:MAG: hypothetical protein M3Y72_17560 [Acidobacteriota bacterium]|nr:hypothetical protein [Acidobacteriota bacterium]
MSLYTGGPGPSGSLKHFNQAFTYDGMNRLKTASDNGGWTRSFGYDAFWEHMGRSASSHDVGVAGQLRESNHTGECDWGLEKG